MTGTTYVDKLTVTESLRARELHDRADEQGVEHGADPDNAAVFSDGAAPGKNFHSGPLIRSLLATIASLQAQVARGRVALLSNAAP